jgi:glutaredoxin-related protein
MKYEWIDANKNPEERRKLSFYYEWKTVPGIFLNKKFIGGYSDLMELKNSGEIVF